MLFVAVESGGGGVASSPMRMFINANYLLFKKLKKKIYKASALYKIYKWPRSK